MRNDATRISSISKATTHDIGHKALFLLESVCYIKSDFFESDVQGSMLMYVKAGSHRDYAVVWLTNPWRRWCMGNTSIAASCRAASGPVR